MFCPICGKSLEDGEVCGCSAQNNAAEPKQTASEAGPQHMQQGGSALPQGKELAEGAKNAANAVKNNPYVAEVIKAVGGSLRNPVKQTADSAKRKDILWLILAVLEGLLYAIATTVFVRRICYVLFSQVGSAFGQKLKYSEMADFFKEMGLSVPKQLGMGLLSFLITAVIAVVLMMITVSVCKRKADISQCGNMLAAAFLPAGLLMAVSVIVSFIYAPAVILLFAGGYIAFIILGYLGMQKLDKFEVSPFWFYTVFALIVTAAGIFVSAKLTGVMFEEIFDELKSSLSYLF